ncbi:SDR family oxidoreductase [Nitrosopumilus piranensis]|uniref:dTDP-4-dehydrorhamnose reductase n=1 Tax=Nitrosopumilus piranensis TaxID=1582439 RepID=A0A0C5BNI8_9ARCH|nr:SDR family oxidoreductase [Nitrosopumilus piranensis]AJM91273.1 dTDP-4-dehydrorhamnose reductase [Nitrosopumilus piranensis]
MTKKLLIIGGSGLVGSTLLEYADDYELHVTYNTNPFEKQNVQTSQLNLLDNEQDIIDLIKNLEPDVVINTVAHPSVDLCEKNPEIANNLHVKTTKIITDICSKINSKLIYFSTDAVFDGKTDLKYVEKDLPNPINYYGLTKLNAEKIVLCEKNNVILRTSVIYGNHKKSRFTNWIIGNLIQNKIVDPHVDQFNTPTLVDDLAISILKIISKDVSGLFHATGKTCLNRYEFAKEISSQFGFDSKLILPVTSEQKKQEAPRPKKTCLDSSKLEKIIDYEFCDIKKGISFLVENSHKLDYKKQN